MSSAWKKTPASVKSASPLPSATSLPPPRPTNDQVVADLKRRLNQALVHINQLKANADSSPGHLAPHGVATVAEGALTELKAARKDSAVLSEEVLALEEALKREKATARNNLRNVLEPLMVDSVLRYIAVDEHNHLLLNPTWSLPYTSPGAGAPLYNHYPTKRYLKELRNRTVLSPELYETLLAGLVEVKHKSGSQHHAQYERNKAAHPTGLNGHFEKYARLLDGPKTSSTGDGPWMKVFRHLVATKKGRAADVLGDEKYGPARGTQPWNEAELWNPSAYDEDGHPHTRGRRDNGYLRSQSGRSSTLETNPTDPDYIDHIHRTKDFRPYYSAFPATPVYAHTEETER